MMMIVQPLPAAFQEALTARYRAIPGANISPGPFHYAIRLAGSELLLEFMLIGEGAICTLRLIDNAGRPVPAPGTVYVRAQKLWSPTVTEVVAFLHAGQSHVEFAGHQIFGGLSVAFHAGSAGPVNPNSALQHMGSWCLWSPAS